MRFPWIGICVGIVCGVVGNLLNLPIIPVLVVGVVITISILAVRDWAESNFGNKR